MKVRLLVVALVALGASQATASAATATEFAAHRGEHSVATENGMPAYAAAIELGVPWLETDVRRNKSGALVVMHDRGVRRTTNGMGRVAQLTSRQLDRLRLDDGSRIPYLRQVLELAFRRGVRLLVELKAMGGAESYQRLRRIIRATGMQRRVVITSLRPHHLEKVTALAPRLRTALVTRQPVAVAEVAGYADAVALEHTALTAEYAADLRAASLDAYAWTPNDPAAWDRLAPMVAIIITDNAIAAAGYQARPSG